MFLPPSRPSAGAVSWYGSDARYLKASKLKPRFPCGAFLMAIGNPVVTLDERRAAMHLQSRVRAGGSVPQRARTGQLSAGPFPKAFRATRAIESICAIQFPGRPVISAAGWGNAAIITVMCSTFSRLPARVLRWCFVH
jgi:hypothetical protein